MRIFKISVAILLLLAIVVLFLPSKAFALLGIGTPFGGMVLFRLECTCSANTMIVVGPPRPGTFMLDAGTVIYEKYTPFIAHWVLGLADAFVPCMVYVGTACVPAGEGGRVRIMGTS